MISVITPFYRGNKYLQQLFLVIQKNYMHLKKEFPEEKDIFMPRQLQYKVKKERPATAKQKKYLAQLIAYHAIREKIDVDQMTQREASKKIDHIIFNYGVMKK